MNLKSMVKELKQNIVVLIIAFSKKETPWYAKAVAAITIAYALSPIDLIPDFIPILGYLDDIVILPLLILLSLKLIPKSVIENCKKESGNTDYKSYKRWYYAIPIILIWTIVFGLIVYIIIKKFNK